MIEIDEARRSLPDLPHVAVAAGERQAIARCIIRKGTCSTISLQVFELARERRPYDEEFLLAALLHDIGKGLDPADHVAAALTPWRA